MERIVHGTKRPRNESSKERNVQGTKRPEFVFRSWERNVLGTKSPVTVKYETPNSIRDWRFY